MKNADQTVDFAHSSDDGQAAPTSIQPIANTETVWPDVANRPVEHLRYRTETLRRSVEDLLHRADYEVGLVLRAAGTFTLTEPASGRFVLALSTGSFWVYPALTPGKESGGRNQGGVVFCENSAASGAWTPYSGTLLTDALILTAHRQYTGQRGYYDGDNFADSSSIRSLGANRIVVDLVADPAIVGGVLNITATITRTPRTKIRVVYGTSGTTTTLSDLVAFINGDRTSQGSYGVADFLRASVSGSTSAPPVPFTNGLVQGAYDAEGHEVTAAQFTAFFDVQDGGGDYVNRLRDGEGLAIGYPIGLVERTGLTRKGGRRQALFDVPTDRSGTRTQNTTPSVGFNLFSTGREPHKIPGAVPLGKMIDGEFVFLDGTRLAVGETLSLGESRATLARLAAQTSGGDGARLVGYEGSVAGGASWNADASATTSPNLPASTVSASLTRVVSNLGSQTLNQSGARRIGVEQISAVVSAGNEDWERPVDAGSLRSALQQILNGTNGAGQAVGLNARVSEHGHRMLGAGPLRKEFGHAGMPSAGAMFTLAELQAPVNLMAATPAGENDFAHVVVQPLVFDDAGGGSIAVDEAASVASATVVTMTGMTSDRFTKMVAYLPVIADGFTGTVPLIFAKLAGLNGGAGNEDGFYIVKTHNTSSQQFTLVTLDGGAPNLAASGAIEVTLYSAFVLGNDKRFSRLAMFHVAGTNLSQKPLAVIGAAYATQPVLDIYTPNGNTGSLGMRIRPKSIEIEGEVLDATRLNNLQYTLLEEATIDGGLALDFTSVRTTALPGAPSGRTNVGIYLRVQATVYSNAAGVVRYQIYLGRPGVTPSTAPIFVDVSWEAAASGEFRTVSISGFVPLSGATSIEITRLTNTNTDPAPPGARLNIYGFARTVSYT